MNQNYSSHELKYRHLLKGEVDYEKLKDHLKQILNVESVGEFIIFPSKLNTTLGFTADENKFVIKLMTAPLITEREKYRYNKVATILKQIANNPNIPAPQVERVEDDKTVIGYRYIILGHIEGERLWSIRQKLTKEDKTSIIKQLVPIVREIHNIEYPFYGELEEYNSPKRYKTFKKKVKTQLSEFVDILLQREIFAKDLVELARDTFIKELEFIRFPVKSSLLHTKIQQDNILVKKDEQGAYKIQALLDWEEARAGNPLEEIYDLQNSLLIDEGNKKIFFEEYSQGKYENLAPFIVDLKLLQILKLFDDVLYGPASRSDNPETMNYAQNDLMRILEKKKS